MTRITTIIALTCFLVFGATAASILGRDSVSGARLELAAASLDPKPGLEQGSQAGQAGGCRHVRAGLVGPPQEVTLSEPLRQAFASTAPVDMVPPQITRRAKPKLVAKPQPPVQQPPVQKSYALLSDVQIAGIKERLKLTSSQESYWPAVESALRGIARKIHASRKADPAALIDPDAEEVQQLKSAAMPLLFQLREDQKREVRTLARIIGLEKVASMI